MQEIFTLYSMSFDDKNQTFDPYPGAYFREFKKAYLSLINDKTWCEESAEIEINHVQCLSLILVFAHRIKSETWMQKNPAELRKNDHGVENDIPPEFSMTPNTRDQLKQIYI